MSELKIREVKPQDLAELVRLCRLHAEFEGVDYDEGGKERKLERAFLEEPRFGHCLIAEFGGRLVGYATATKEFSTWDADHYLHMDCLYVVQEMRGEGVGTSFIGALKTLAKDWGCTHIQWQTPSNNALAISFYRKQNAYSKDKKRFFLEIET